jgi:hypothetical protein
MRGIRRTRSLHPKSVKEVSSSLHQRVSDNPLLLDSLRPRIALGRARTVRPAHVVKLVKVFGNRSTRRHARERGRPCLRAMRCCDGPPNATSSCTSSTQASRCRTAAWRVSTPAFATGSLRTCLHNARPSSGRGHEWLIDFNEVRPHQSLRYRTPH